MMHEEGSYIPPDERTKQLWSEDYVDVRADLLGRVIVMPNGVRLRIDEVKAWNIAENAKKAAYRKMSEMQPGTVYLPTGPYPKTRLALIVANDGETTGACVQISKGSIFNAQKGVYENATQTKIADAFSTELMPSGRLAFKDDSQCLHWIAENGESEVSQTTIGNPVASDPGNAIDRVLGEIFPQQ